MFFFKKVVGPLFLPLTFCLLMLMIGFLLLWLKKKEKIGKVFIACSVLFLTVFSYNSVANRITTPLECRYAAVRLSDTAGTRWIAVLGGGATVMDQTPATSQLTNDSLSRLAEGIRLHRQIPGSKLLLSGGAVFQFVPEAEVMAKAARELGIPEKNIVLESASRDTEEQARIIHGIVGRDKFVLVTSSLHMPRAMALFQKRQLTPIAAPSDVCISNKEPLSPMDFYPNAVALQRSESAIHEYLGILWSKIRGKI